MKVLLVSVNREDFPDPTYPLGLSLVAGAARAAGHEVELVDLRSCEGSLREAVGARRPGAVGIGIRNVDNLTWGRSKSYLGEIGSAVGELRKAFGGPLILGGSGFSLFPRELLAELDVPFGVVGEGERAFPELLGALERRTDPFGIPGVAVGSRSGRFRVTAPVNGPAGSLSARPAEDLLREYVREGAAVGVQTKRGCPFRCSYCTYPALEGRELRLRDPAEVVAEVEALAGKGVRSVFFVDDAFNVPADHAEAICRGLVERGVRIAWSAFAHPRLLPPRLAGWMKRSGCAGLEFGTDSLSDRVLAELRKGFTSEDARRAAAAAAGAGLKTAHYLLLGSPGETRATLEATLSAFDELPPAAVIAMVGVRIYPGTALAELARREGRLVNGTSLLPPAFYFSPEIDVEELLARLRARALAGRSWIVPSLGVRCAPELLARLRGRGAPSWTFLLKDDG